jgi:anthranilate synthase component 2
MILMIDNYDSFTYNLVHYLGELGAQIQVFRNDEITLKQIEALAPSHLVISPGPCTPTEAGISMEAIRYFADKLPILGVCLGHEAMAQVFGGRVIHAKQVMHGKTSPIYHQQQGVFHELPQPFNATRYHSLIAEKTSLPDCFDITAWTLDEKGAFEEIMAIQHKEFPMHGVQFHPESILTEKGHQLLKNFLQG